jgi:hypothetical protein
MVGGPESKILDAKSWPVWYDKSRTIQGGGATSQNHGERAAFR